MRGLVGVLAVVPAAVLAVAVGLAPAAAAAVTYRPPVDAPVVDPFRPPAQDWNAGNRGLEYATVPGTAVAASAPGEVVFAGPVAGELHVVVLHDDGLRTSYSFLRTVSVHRGERVRQGQPVGTAKDRFHFGARAGDAYLDPARLFGEGTPEVYLVPDARRRPGTEAEERDGLVRLFRNFGSRVLAGGSDAVGWARDNTSRVLADSFDELRGAVLFAGEGQPFTHVVRFAVAAGQWWAARDTCTPATVAAPRLQERHLAVLVAGLGSTSGHASIDDVDTAALGYARADVVRYSYNGGTTADHPYAAEDTTTDLRQSARRLRELLVRLEAEHPGVPVDVVAHSQGGLVARAALTDEIDRADTRLPAVASLITLGSPHEGAPLATALTMAGHSRLGQALETGTHMLLPGMVDPAGVSVTQLAEESSFVRLLSARPLPAGLRATSIGAREDLVVPAGVTHLRGADNVVVSVPGHAAEHTDLPGSAQAQREIALGLAGMAPTCQGLADALADAVVSDAVRSAETSGGAGAWLGGRLLDRSPPTPRRFDS